MVAFATECRNQIFFKDNDPIIRQIMHYVSNHQSKKINRNILAKTLSVIFDPLF